MAGKPQVSDEDSASRQLRREEQEDYIVLGENELSAHQLSKPTKSNHQAVGTQETEGTSRLVPGRTRQEKVPPSSDTDHLHGKRDSNGRLEPLTLKRRRLQVELEQNRPTGSARGRQNPYEIPDSPRASSSIPDMDKAEEMTGRGEVTSIDTVQDKLSASAAGRESNQSKGDKSKAIELDKPTKRGRGRPRNVKQMSTELVSAEKRSEELPVASKSPARNAMEDLNGFQSKSNSPVGHHASGQPAQPENQPKAKRGRRRKYLAPGDLSGDTVNNDIDQDDQSQRQGGTSKGVSGDRAQEPDEEDERTKSGDNGVHNSDGDEEVDALGSEDDYNDATDAEISAVESQEGFPSVEGHGTDDGDTLQLPSRDHVMFGRELPWKKIVNAARSVGTKGKGQDLVRYKIPIESNGIKNFLWQIKQAGRCYKTLALVEGDTDGDETKREDELDSILEGIAQWIEDLRSGDIREDRKLIHDIYAHAIPRMIFLLRAALAARAAIYTDPKDEIVIQELINIQELVLRLCQSARESRSQPKSSDPPIILQTSRVILPILRDSILPAFQGELEDRVETRKQAKRDARKAERERQRAAEEAREEAERDERIRRKWKRAADDAIRSDAQLPPHLRVLPLSQVSRDTEPHTHDILFQKQRSPEPAEPRDEQMLELIRLLKELQDLPGTCYA